MFSDIKLELGPFQRVLVGGSGGDFVEASDLEVAQKTALVLFHDVLEEITRMFDEFFDPFNFAQGSDLHDPDHVFDDRIEGLFVGFDVALGVIGEFPGFLFEVREVLC